MQQCTTPSPPSVPPTLSQQLFPSSSPSVSQEPCQDRTLGPSTPRPSWPATAPKRILQPSTSSTLNQPRSNGRLRRGDPPRRPALRLSNTSSSKREDSLFSGRADVVDLTPASCGGRSVGKLHETVYFDENDFDDDTDLDLDTVHPSVNQVPSTSKLAQTPSTRPVTSAALDRQPTTSQPVPWSSSPAYHMATPPRARSLRRPVSSGGPEGHVRRKAPASHPSQRHTSPWLDPHEQGTAEESPPRVQRSLGRKRKQLHGENDGESLTRSPTDKLHPPYPGNPHAAAAEGRRPRLQPANPARTENLEGGGAETITGAATKKWAVARVFLSNEQKKVLQLVVDETKSVFFTGSAGTGKSVLLVEIIKALRDKYKKEPDRVAVTASTGLAACNIGGVTLHSFGGIGLGKEPVPELIRKIQYNRRAKQRWLRTKALIVDEISMVDGDLFDKLEAIARTIRKGGRPFGGIQLIITGDFFQLPPVPDPGKVSKFAFDAATWKTSVEHTIGLTQVFRQKDPVFANMLNEMRLGTLTSGSIGAFQKLDRPLAVGDALEATELFPTRKEVDRANSKRMNSLGGSAVEFKAVDGGSTTDVQRREKLLQGGMAPPLVTLKKGAQVMLIKNIDDRLVNGSVGKVTGFMDKTTFDYFHANEDEFQTAHPTMALEDEAIAPPWKKKTAPVRNKDLVEGTGQKWPLVRFMLADGSSRELLCQRESWKVELPNGEVQASRSQIPLILAWALSIHKAQGQTLNRVKVNLGKIFEKGQAYVALSRATCQEGLQITRFDVSKVMAHDKVRQFYESLRSVKEATTSAKGGTVPNARDIALKGARGR